MYYITFRQSPAYHQMTIEEFLFGLSDKPLVNLNISNTRTYEREDIPDKIKDRIDVDSLIDKLVNFNELTESLHNVDRHELYRHFCIPKRSGGLRPIDAPNDELMDALRILKRIFEKDFGALYHTSAFAYIEKRSTIDCIKRHQSNESKWFLKLDLSNFFGSTTPEFVTQMFSMIFPFSEVIKDERGKQEFLKAIDLAFLDGGLPQGTPISPMITNVMMIPVDYTLTKKLRDFNKQQYVYTRYADDYIISSKYNFCFRDVEKLVIETLNGFKAPFNINTKKTRYGSSAGSNWNLGLMLNKDNKITVGFANKRRLKAMLNSYAVDYINGVEWPIEDVYHLDGTRSYYETVEGDVIKDIVKRIGDKYGLDLKQVIHNQLTA